MRNRARGPLEILAAKVTASNSRQLAEACGGKTWVTFHLNAHWTNQELNPNDPASVRKQGVIIPQLASEAIIIEEGDYLIFNIADCRWEYAKADMFESLYAPDDLRNEPRHSVEYSPSYGRFDIGSDYGPFTCWHRVNIPDAGTYHIIKDGKLSILKYPGN